MAEPGLRLVDSHCHIDLPQFDSDRAQVVARARAAGVGTMMVVGGFDAEAGHRRALRVAEELGLPASAGIHPHEARLAEEAAYDELRGWAREGRIRAIGECGLDFHYDHSPRPVQVEVFRRQIHLAREVGRPLVVHTREADAETADLLEREGAAEVGGVIHCFTGGEELARRALALGFCISFSGIVAFPRAETIQRVARAVPADRLLVETDAPFLAPPPHRGQRNEPAFVVEVARAVAAQRGQTVEEIGRLATENFTRLFGVTLP
ncbi:MAG TPA: TatD family hydrolase [Vicinamibacteria bacterium]|nr:TatD family hydrolase [Vicinamibacteria bacterium]